MVLMIALMVLPIIMVIGYSFLDNVIMQADSTFVGAVNYVKVLTDPVFYEAARNTLVFTVISVVFHMLIGLFFALLLNTDMVNRIVRSIFRVIFILPWVFTAAIIAILWRLILYPNGILNYFLSVINLIGSPIEWLGSRQTAMIAICFINIWAGYPFYMVSLLAGLQGISVDLYEAATVDGASALQKFFSITIPQLKPIIVSMGMLDIIWTSQQFSMVWMTTGGGPVHATEMVSTYTYKQAFQTYTFSLASTSAVIILLISLCLAAFYVRNQRGREQA
jgi:multiple sugar transport system permease protein